MNQSPHVDSVLLERAMRLSGESSASVVLAKALEEFIERRSAARILELMGKLEWDAGYSYKRERTRH